MHASAHAAGATRLIAVECGGVLVLGEQSITYHSGSDFKSLAIPFACFKAFEKQTKHTLVLVPRGVYWYLG